MACDKFKETNFFSGHDTDAGMTRSLGCTPENEARMSRLPVALLLVVASALPAAAQRMAPDPLAGVARPAQQNLDRPDARAMVPRQGFQAERARRAEQQARFNRNFPGTPLRLVATRR
jgi:hypothetical protein